MAIYTIIASHRKEQHVFQVRAPSVADALRKWSAELDYSRISNFGELSKRRLIDAVTKMQFGPVATPGLVNVHKWYSTISEFPMAVVIVETDPDSPPAPDPLAQQC